MKKWLSKAGEREQEARDRKKKRLEEMAREPHHVFHDTEYDQQRSDLTTNVSDALEQGEVITTILCIYPHFALSLKLET